MRLLEVEDDTAGDLAVFHVLEDLGEVFQLCGAEVGLCDATSCKLECLDSLLTVSDGRADDAESLGDDECWECSCDRYHVALGDTHADEGASYAEHGESLGVGRVGSSEDQSAVGTKTICELDDFGSDVLDFAKVDKVLTTGLDGDFLLASMVDTDDAHSHAL